MRRHRLSPLAIVMALGYAIAACHGNAPGPALTVVASPPTTSPTEPHDRVSSTAPNSIGSRASQDAPPADATASPSASKTSSDTSDTAGSSTAATGITHDGVPVLPKDLFALPGPITGDTTPDDLRRIYGPANVREGDVPGAEGTTAHGITLFPTDPKRRAYVYYEDQDKLKQLSMVSVQDDGSQWRGARGVRIGMPLSELVAANAGPFEMLGFDWDYGGQVTDWLGGRLASASDAATLRVQLRHGALPKNVPYSKLPIGDRTFRSDHPQMAKMQTVVGGISISFPGMDDQ